MKKHIRLYEAVMLALTAVLICALFLLPGPGAGVHTESGSAQKPFSFLSGGRVNINTATAEELQVLPGIGAVKAQAIVDYREKYGGFGGEYELLAVSGIGLDTMEGLIDYICVEDIE